MPATENAVPAGGAIDSHEIAPLAVQAPTALPVCADKATAGRLTLAVADPVADPTVSVSDSGARLPPVVADPVASPVGEESDAVGRSALAVAAPVADPVAADSESDGRMPSAETAPPPPAEGRKIARESLRKIESLVDGFQNAKASSCVHSLLYSRT